MIELDPHSQEAVPAAIAHWRRLYDTHTFGAKKDTVGIVYAQPSERGIGPLEPTSTLTTTLDFFDAYSEKREAMHKEDKPQGKRPVVRLGGMTLENISTMLNNPRISHIELIGIGDGSLLLDDSGEAIDWAQLRPRDLKQGDVRLFTFEYFMPARQYHKPLLPPTSFCFLHPTSTRVTTRPLDPELFGQDDDIAIADALHAMGTNYRQPAQKQNLALQLMPSELLQVDLTNPSAIVQLLEKGIERARRTMLAQA